MYNRVYCYSGIKRTWIAGFLQFLTLYGTGIAYVLTTATCLGYFPDKMRKPPLFF